MSEGTLETIDGRPALRFTRRLAHPIERVWRAVSAHDELAAWFVAPLDFTHAGQRFEPGEVLRFEPPRLVALNDRYAERFGLDPEVGRRQIAEHYGSSG